MDNNIIAIKEILERNDYRVNVISTDNGCIAIFPKRVDPPLMDYMRLQYEYIDNGLRVLAFDKDNNLYVNQSFNCINYSQRLLMFCHIISNCVHMNFAISLVKFSYVGNEVDESTFYDKCVSKYMTQEDLDKEKILKPIIISAIFTSFNEIREQMCKTAGILEGYIAIRDLLPKQP